ncbi:circadian clock KaiB family protein [Methylobacterium oryzisoli]|uniref:circadian clock KaiB family protein n=1 Tax=Methylobacterium oryzisoli TaxID=3385502 RepID=UPI0038916E81
MSAEGPQPDETGPYLLRLFVAGTSARSLRTVETLHGLCGTHLRDRYALEVVDIYQQPDLAQRDGVLAAPTLLRIAPPPARRITGDLSDEGRVLRGLGLTASPGGADER